MSLNSHYILGVSAYYHDAAAALVCDGEVVAAAQEERFTRKKHDPGFPANAVRFCLGEAGLQLADVAVIAFYDKPLLKFERLLETYYAFAPRGLRSFLMSMPVWIKEKLFQKRLLWDHLEEVAGPALPATPMLFPEHHLSHAASAFYPSPFDEAAVLTIDGVGEWATASLCHGEGTGMRILKELKFPHSVGLLYSAFTYFLGFRVNSGEYKLMGLAPYGDPGSAQVAEFERKIHEELLDVAPDGSIWLNQDYFDYATGLRMVREDLWQRLFGMPRRDHADELEMRHCNLGLAIQRVTEDIMLKMAAEAKRLTGSRNLCLAGGVALNCVGNGKLQRSGLFDRVWIQPAAGDAGGALGAALAAWHLHLGGARTPCGPLDRMRGSLIGPDTTEKDTLRMIRRFAAEGERFEDFDRLCARVAEIMDSGAVVGWVQGRMEWGPRALGNRSIIGDPRSPEMQRKMNVNIKYRESFRPFAPSVLAEEAGEYFDLRGADSPYMLLVADVLARHRKPLPEGYGSMSVREKLYTLRSSLPAITHIDFSARVQTVHREVNGRYWRLLRAFKERTGCPAIVNTSFNVRGEPIVCTPEDAYRCFMRTDMDALVVGDYLFEKRRQPPWPEDRRWKEEFVLD